MKVIDKKAYALAKRVLETVDWKNCDERRVLDRQRNEVKKRTVLQHELGIRIFLLQRP